MKQTVRAAPPATKWSQVAARQKAEARLAKYLAAVATHDRPERLQEIDTDMKEAA